MDLRRLIQLLFNGDRRTTPRTPEAIEAVRRKRTIEHRLRRLEMDLQVHVGKQRHDR